MDFIENIGERYLMGKANAAPQMLENLARKQFASAPDPNKPAVAEQPSTLPSTSKDDEIATLRKQLADAKLEKPKASGKAKSVAGSTRAASVRSVKSKASHKDGGVKEMKGLTPLSITALAASQAHHSRERRGSDASRGRRASISTATAAKPQHAPSEVKGGGHTSKAGSVIHAPSEVHSVSHNPKAGTSIQGLEKVGAPAHTAAGSHKAASSAGSAHASVRSRSVAQRSEIGSLVRKTNAGGPARPPPPPASVHREVGPTKSSSSTLGDRVVARREPGKQVEEIRLREIERVEREYEDEEPGLYVVEVEEDVPVFKRGKGGIGRGGEVGKGGVVEVSHGKGRTVYKVC